MAVTRQMIRVTVVGATWDDKNMTPVKVEFEQEIVLDRGEPGTMEASQYRAQHAEIENRVIDALNKVQGKLATARGDNGF